MSAGRRGAVRRRRGVATGQLGRARHQARRARAAAVRRRANGRERAGALAELLVGGFRPEPKAVDGLWLDEVLNSRRGHPVLLAAMATELGRRSGWEVTVCSCPTGWYAGLHEDSVLWLVDPTGDASGERAP